MSSMPPKALHTQTITHHVLMISRRWPFSTIPGVKRMLSWWAWWCISGPANVLAVHEALTNSIDQWMRSLLSNTNVH